MVREFRNKKILSTSKENSQIDPIDDIGRIIQEEESDEHSSDCDKIHPIKLNDVHVQGVILDRYNGCLKCNTKLVPDDDDPDLGHCPSCKMLQCLASCKLQLSAQLVVKTADQTLTLRAFNKTLQLIAQKPAEITMSILLKAAPFTLIHQDRSVSRKS